MSSELIKCPDCGGIVGGAGGADEGRPCTCFAASTKSSSSSASDSTAVDSAPVPRLKVCCRCGKDLSGRKRLRDSVGYWCMDCHEADQAKKHPDGTACAECGRVVKESALYDYAGRRICGKCNADHSEEDKHNKRFRSSVGSSAYQAEDRRRLYIMVGIFGVLLLLIILHSLHLIGGH